jgi:hypothetical protein
LPFSEKLEEDSWGEDPELDALDYLDDQDILDGMDETENSGGW